MQLVLKRLPYADSLAPRLARAARVFTRVREVFPITWIGFVWISAAGLGLYFFGVKRLDMLLLAASSIALGLVVLCLLFVPLCAWLAYRAAKRTHHTGSLGFEANHAHPTGFVMPTFWYLPLARATWVCEGPDASVETKLERGVYKELAKAHRRGVHEAIVRRFEVADPIGLTRVTFRVTEQRGARVLPARGNLKAVHVLENLAGGDGLPHPSGTPEGDRVDLRHYAPGDPIRYVLWKTYAKSRDLVVRMPERAVSPIQHTVAYFVAGPSDEASAGAARAALDSGALGKDWIFGADGSRELSTTAPLAIEALCKSAHTPEDQQGRGLADFLKQASPAGATGASRAIVFVPAEAGDWLTATLGSIRQTRANVEFVVCADRFESDKELPRWKRWLTRKPTIAKGQVAVRLEKLEALVQKLSGGSATTRQRVWVLDRQTGRSYDGIPRAGTGGLR